MIRHLLAEIGWQIWHVWYRIVFKTERVGNIRRVTNRFTGHFNLYRVAPLSLVGVNFNDEQTKMILQLYRDDMLPQAQELILRHIESEYPDVERLLKRFERIAKMENAYTDWTADGN